jgi:hypothetical protein
MMPNLALGAVFAFQQGRQDLTNPIKLDTGDKKAHSLTLTTKSLEDHDVSKSGA